MNFVQAIVFNKLWMVCYKNIPLHHPWHSGRTCKMHRSWPPQHKRPHLDLYICTLHFEFSIWCSLDEFESLFEFSQTQILSFAFWCLKGLFFSYFQRKQGLMFHMNPLLGRGFIWNRKPYFLQKIKRKKGCGLLQFCLALWEFNYCDRYV